MNELFFVKTLHFNQIKHVQLISPDTLPLKNLLIKHWGHSNFRPLQEEIINSVMAGHDTLALLPTGGGKSICYQVPGMALDGLCLVVSPLIALMKDQVEGLKKRGIKAEAIYSGIHFTQIDRILDNASFGDLKFLYVSPERLVTESFKDRLNTFKLNLIAGDEAHCISHWGYVFIPPYLKIAEIRAYFPKTPVMALTATATKPVMDDIQEKLKFKDANVFKKSFERKNIAYVVQKEENKLQKLLKVVQGVKGCGIVYVRNRRKTIEIADYLQKHATSAQFYHAGLSNTERNKRQEEWMQNKSSIMVATNAFGMGIDKADVRFVVHFDLPDSPEAYFQEAGRAGRDEKKSFAILLYQDADITELTEQVENAYPPLDEIRRIYKALGNYCKLVIGSGKDSTFDFELPAFVEQYNLKPSTTFSALKILEREGYILLSDAINQPSQLMIHLDGEEMYRFQVENKFYGDFLKTISRIYGGIYTELRKISEEEIAKRMGQPEEKIVQVFNYLQQIGVITYVPRKDKPQITFTSERLNENHVTLSQQNYQQLKIEAFKRMEAVIAYATNLNKCRSQLLLEYFDETQTKRCGHCDYCLKRNKMEMSDVEFQSVIERIKPLLKTQHFFVNELVEKFPEIPEDNILKVLLYLREYEKVLTDDENRFYWSA